MKENHKSLISTFSKLDISQKNFGDRSSILSNLSKIGYPIVEGFFISYDIMKQIEIGINIANGEWEELAANSKRMFIIDTTLHVRSLLN